MKSDTSQSARREELQEWFRFIRADSHILKERPHLFFQQAANQPDSTTPARMARQRFEAGIEKRPWLRRINKPQGNPACVLTLTGQSLSRCSFSPDGSRLLSGGALWDAATGAEIMTLEQDSQYSDWVFSPDGTRIISVTCKGLVVRDAWSGEKLVDISRGANPGVSLIPFALSCDGKLIAAPVEIDPQSGAKAIKVWNLEDCRETLTIHSGETQAMAFSNDGARLVAGFRDRGLKIWDTATGAELIALRSDATFQWGCMSSPTGVRMPLFGNLPVKVWNEETGEEIKSLTGHLDSVQCCAFSPDGKAVASGGRDGMLKLWNATTGDEIATCALENSSEIVSQPVPAEGEAVVSQPWDGLRKLWAAVTRFGEFDVLGREIGFTAIGFAMNGERIIARASVYSRRDSDFRHHDFVKVIALFDSQTGRCLAQDFGNSFALSPDETMIAVASDSLRLWDTATGRLISTIEGGQGSVHGCSFSPDGTHLVSALGSALKVWDIRAHTEASDSPAHKACACVVRFSPDGRWLISGAHDGGLKAWNGESGEMTNTFRGHETWVSDLSFSPDGKRVVSASRDGTLKVWAVDSGEELLTLSGHHRAVYVCDWSSDSDRIVSGSRDATLKLWDADTGRLLTTMTGHESGIAVCVFSPRGDRIVSGVKMWMMAHNPLRVWDTRTGSLIKTLEGHTDEITSLIFSADGSQFLSASKDYTLILWDAVGLEPLATLRGKDWVISCAFSPDGSRIVSAEYNKTLRLWDSRAGDEIAEMTGHTGHLACCGFSPDGNYIISGSHDQTIRVWDVQTALSICEYRMEASVASVDWSRRSLIAVGDYSGRVHLLRTEI